MPKWFKYIKSILQKEPEIWLAYLDGQQLENISHLKTTKPRVRGALLRTAIFFFRMLQATRFKTKPDVERFLIYAGTANQKSALEGTLIALHDNACKVTALARYEHFDRSSGTLGYQPVIYSPLDVIKTAILIFARFKWLRHAIDAEDKFLLKNRLGIFFDVYAHLVYFERLLRHQKPDFIIVSNDHNGDNRSLLALADEHGIDTVYLQHASVSNLFPALNFKYAFLDGQAAAETYQECEGNHPPNKPRRSDRRILLSGQKKKMAVERQPEVRSVGVALNALDNPEDVDAFLSAVESKGISAKVRWHPGLKGRALRPFLDILAKHHDVAWSDPGKESVEKFLGSIKALIAGNSSIHLEAALSGVVPIYYEFSPADHSDYYGYVNKGVCKQAQNVEELAQVVEDIYAGRAAINTQAVQYFSATYGTEWEGREGEFVVRELLSEGQQKKDKV